jgi:molecular chaperone DnaK
MGFYIGCDLGTTYSVVSFINKENKPIFIKDASGSTLIPSVVCFIDGNYVGRDAVDLEEDWPKSTIRSSKRYIGQQIELLEDITPTDVAEQILRYLKQLCINYFGNIDLVEGMVITVPAYFNQNQRAETKKAAEAAGFNVLRIINEPTAAALAYGEETKLNELVLVYDLGGGTFDVTLLQLSEEGVYQVLSTSGNTQLGGDDFDNIIVNLFKENLPENFKPFSDFNVRAKKFAEEIKIQLNYKDVVRKTLKYSGTINGKIHHHKIEITREKYKEKIQHLLAATKSHVLNALNDANKKISSLDKIILVGGSTKSQYVRDFVAENFKTKIYFEIDPDLTVSLGAANLAHSLKNKNDKSTVLIDVTPLSLGIEVKGGLMHKIIPRNATIPTSNFEEFITSHDDQDIVVVKIYQGERPLAKDNEFLGEFELSGFEKRPKGQTKIIVKFEIDVSGLVKVSAIDKMSGLNANIQLKSLTTSEASNVLDDLEMNYLTDKQIEEQLLLEKLQQTAQTLIFSLSIKNNVDEYKETYELVKNNVNNLQVLIQELNELTKEI